MDPEKFEKTVSPEGEVYEGEWQDGKRHGKAKHTMPVGSVYEGEYQNDQWHGMGKELMQLQVFQDSIMKSEEALKPYGISIYDIIMKGTKDTFEDTKNSFVGIAAIQVSD